MRCLQFLAATTALALSATGVPADAAVMTAAFDGAVLTGQDDAQAFAPEGYELAGKSFRATLTFNPARGGSAMWDTPQRAERSGFDADSPVTRLTLWIGNTKRTVDVDFSSLAKENGDPGQADSFRIEASNVFTCSDLCVSANFSLASTQVNVFDQADLSTAFARIFGAGDAVTGVDLLLTSAQGTTLVTANIGSIAVEAAPAIPEPASWAFMILGFGATAVRLRRLRNGASIDRAPSGLRV
jgi:hypothetical protein